MPEAAGPASPSTLGQRAGTDAPAPVTRRNLFAHYETHPVVLDVTLLHKYNADWYTWEPATLWQEILADFHVSSISDHNKAKIQAVRTLHLAEWYWTQWEVFNWITQALNGCIPEFQVIQKPTVAQLMNSVDVAALVRDGEQFGPEVQMYTAAAMADDGVYYAPRPLTYCQDEIKRLLEVTRAEHVMDLIQEVKNRLAEVSAINDVEWTRGEEPVLHENPIDIQVAKLKVANDYLKLRRRQLRDQLGLLQ